MRGGELQDRDGEIGEGILPVDVRLLVRLEARPALWVAVRAPGLWGLLVALVARAHDGEGLAGRADEHGYDIWARDGRLEDRLQPGVGEVVRRAAALRVDLDDHQVGPEGVDGRGEAVVAPRPREEVQHDELARRCCLCE